MVLYQHTPMYKCHYHDKLYDKYLNLIHNMQLVCSQPNILIFDERQPFTDISCLATSSVGHSASDPTTLRGYSSMLSCCRCDAELGVLILSRLS